MSAYPGDDEGIPTDLVLRDLSSRDRGLLARPMIGCGGKSDKPSISCPGGDSKGGGTQSPAPPEAEFVTAAVGLRADEPLAKSRAITPNEAEPRPPRSPIAILEAGAAVVGPPPSPRLPTRELRPAALDIVRPPPDPSPRSIASTKAPPSRPDLWTKRIPRDMLLREDSSEDEAAAAAGLGEAKAAESLPPIGWRSEVAALALMTSSERLEEACSEGSAQGEGEGDAAGAAAAEGEVATD